MISFFNPISKKEMSDRSKIFIGKGIALGIIVSQIQTIWPLLSIFSVIGIMSYYTDEKFTAFIDNITKLLWENIISHLFQRFYHYLLIFSRVAAYIISSLINFIFKKIFDKLVKWEIFFGDEMNKLIKDDKNKSFIAAKDFTSKIVSEQISTTSSVIIPNQISTTSNVIIPNQISITPTQIPITPSQLRPPLIIQKPQFSIVAPVS